MLYTNFLASMLVIRKNGRKAGTYWKNHLTYLFMFYFEFFTKLFEIDSNLLKSCLQYDLYESQSLNYRELILILRIPANYL